MLNEKVFCDYGYASDIYKATGIFPQDLECSLVSVKSSFIISIDSPCFRDHALKLPA